MSELGDILHAAREKRNLTTADVAHATHIKQSFIEALEVGEYALLPGPAYITGFLRNYATFLGLNPDDLVQEYYAGRTPLVPTVKAATRVLASGHERHNRKRLYWALAAVALLLFGGFVVKQYNAFWVPNTNASAPNITPANVGAVQPTPERKPVQTATFQLQLQAVHPVWVRVTADGQRVFQGMLRPQAVNTSWSAHHAIFVATYNGSRLVATLNGRPQGVVASTPGLVVNEATASGWRPIS